MDGEENMSIRYEVTLPVKGYVTVFVTDDAQSGMQAVIDAAKRRLHEAIGDANTAVVVDDCLATVERVSLYEDKPAA